MTPTEQVRTDRKTIAAMLKNVRRMRMAAQALASRHPSMGVAAQDLNRLVIDLLTALVEVEE